MDGVTTVRTDSQILETRYGEAPAGEVQMLLCVKDGVRNFYFWSENLLIKIKRNVRSLLVEYGDWGARAYGAAMEYVALQNLRVCWKNRKGTLNCGRCEKCIRTMIGLHTVGVFNISKLFDRPLRAWRVLGVKIPHPDSAVGQLYNLAELKKEPSFRALYWALRIGFLRSRLKCWMKTWRSRNHE
jgi:hypothetical protein